MTEIIYNGYDLDNLNIQYGLGMNPYLEDGSLKTMQHRPLEMQNAAREINSFSKSNIKNLKPTQGIPYGDHPKQTFDLYRAEGDRAPVFVFFSGGQYQRARAGVWSIWAKKMVENGVSFIDMNYPQIPDVRYPSMIQNVIDMVYWLRGTGTKFNIDINRIFLSGHSSGASIVSCAVAMMTNDNDIQGIKGLYIASGSYDMLPCQIAYRGSILHLSTQEIISTSALRIMTKSLPPLLTTCGGKETAEMKRQQRVFAEEQMRIGGIGRYHEVENENHFSMAHDMYRENSVPWKFISKHI